MWFEGRPKGCDFGLRGGPDVSNIGVAGCFCRSCIDGNVRLVISILSISKNEKKFSTKTCFFFRKNKNRRTCFFEASVANLKDQPNYPQKNLWDLFRTNGLGQSVYSRILGEIPWLQLEAMLKPWNFGRDFLYFNSWVFYVFCSKKWGRNKPQRNT